MASSETLHVDGARWRRFCGVDEIYIYRVRGGRLVAATGGGG